MTRRGRIERFLSLLALCLLTATSCSSASEPRRSVLGASETEQAALTARSFDSPRRQFVVQAEPDIGDVTFRGTVTGRNPHQVSAPADGRVLEVFFGRSDPVQASDDVLVFVPDPSAAELIAVDIAMLEVDRLLAASAPQSEVDRAEVALTDLLASFDARASAVVSGETGVIGPTRRNISYSVDEGDVLFEISDPTDVVVTFGARVDDLASIQIGTPVSLTASGTASTEVLTGSVSDVPDASDLDRNDTVTVTATLDDPNQVELGDRLTVALAATTSLESRWVPLEAVGRQAGNQYILIANQDGRLQRFEVLLGRRTLSHVQVLSALDVGTILVAP